MSRVLPSAPLQDAVNSEEVGRDPKNIFLGPFYFLAFNRGVPTAIL